MFCLWKYFVVFFFFFFFFLGINKSQSLFCFFFLSTTSPLSYVRLQISVGRAQIIPSLCKTLKRANVSILYRADWIS